MKKLAVVIGCVIALFVAGCVIAIVLLRCAAQTPPTQIAFTRQGWEQPSSPMMRWSMLEDVQKRIVLGKTTRKEIEGELGTNTLPRAAYQGHSDKPWFYDDRASKHDLVFYVGHWGRPDFETEWIYLCIDFDIAGICTNVLIAKPSA